MSFRDTEFREACLAWISALSGDNVTTTADLVDARILIEITTEADPDYFATASLVLPSQPGEPNLDALAQLARLLLRYFEQGLGRQLTRDYVPGVISLTNPPFDDLWRLLVLVVSATLLSERNSASNVYENMDETVQAHLQSGIGGMWDGEQQSLIELDTEDVALSNRVTEKSVDGFSTIPFYSGIENDNRASQVIRQQSPLQPRSLHYETSNDSFLSVMTSPQQFQSAYSSPPAQSQQSLNSGVQGSSESLSWQRQSRHRSPQQKQSQRHSNLDTMRISPFHQPALLHTTEAAESINTIITSTSGSTQHTRSMIGFVESESDEEERAGISDSDSYISEFSQDLEEYGQDVVSVGFNGPNAYAAYLFVANAFVYIVTGCYLLLSTTAPQKKSPYFKDYYEMTAATLQIVLLSILSAAISIAWVQLLRFQTRKVVWMTTLSVPVVGTATAVWAGMQLLQVSGAEQLIGYRIRNGVVITISLILVVRFCWSISQRRQDIERSVDIIKLACNVLMQNRVLYAFSLLLLAFYGAFSVASAIFATRLPLFGGLSGTSNISGWLANGNMVHKWGIAAYLLTTFAWCSAVFVQLLRVVVAMVVCQWYFHRHDPNEPPVLHTLQASTISALTHQFGTVVLSATFLFVAKTLHLIELLLRWTVSLLRVVPVSLVSLVVGQPIYFAEGWSSYTAVYAAFTGKGFFESSRTVTQLLNKHHLLHSPVVSLIKSSMTCYALLLSLVIGYILGMKGITTISMHSTLIAFTGSAMPFALLQLVTHVLSCTVEALVVCYAIDLEVDSCHSINVVEAMAAV
ncbi:hypothetical protein COEREDRAFT_87968 [Coemansia reversa NRRL 1564]|uniref:Uncharacterized protein n=1 Tax=Coemansia reversa (strain ATCC 12441 / NRRL 1564) TaxID=763665 RepID=A0A2G5B8L9_COERN|nr:hypothetical protein COEREDRAFT_87968 [Coemansia reversa NRRL 1564]|eukprot:PIA15351.1 hypothetical protein COEREDRAFT_87968 [Coemansia reversa NRRL 1564]